MKVDSLNQSPSACRALSLVLSAILTLGAISPTFGNRYTARTVVPPPQSYELRCRGGALKIKSNPSALDPRTHFITISFEPGTQGAAPIGRPLTTDDILKKRRPDTTPRLNVGQCSWVDRGFRKGEAAQIRLLGTQNLASRLQESLVYQPTAYWRFCAYSTDKGYLLATKHESWEPFSTWRDTGPLVCK